MAAVVPVRTLPSRLAGLVEPKLEFKRNVLNTEADAADQRAAWLEGYGDAASGESVTPR
jgi:hypothetical protein